MRCRMKLIVLCALGILSEPSLAVDESVSASSLSSSSSQSPAESFLDYSSLRGTKDQFSGDKRASAYRSEFKRLPFFTFGLGKRFSPTYDVGTNKVQRGDFAFGMGKRSPLSFSMGQDKRLVSRLMTTGLGKKSISKYNLATDHGKRSISRLTTTGLGKRLPNSYVMGLGKREEWKNMGFGLGKRLSLKDKSFGLGKRTSGMFGLGKRPSSGMFGLGKRSSSGMFGLGKRDYYDDDDNDNDDEVIDYDQDLDAFSQDKRKFDLGLGKRVMELYNDLPEEEKRGNSLNFGMGKRYDVAENDQDDELFE